MNSSPLTCAPELLAFHLADAFVRQPSGVAAAGSTGLDGVVEQVVCQPLQVTVTHEGILGQVTGSEGGERRGRERERRGDGFVMELHSSYGSLRNISSLNHKPCGFKPQEVTETLSSLRHDISSEVAD